MDEKNSPRTFDEVHMEKKNRFNIIFCNFIFNNFILPIIFNIMLSN